MKRNIFLYSDYHFGHANILKFTKRPYKTIDEMNEDIIRRHNKVVKPHDIVYDLGDAVWSTHKFKDFIPTLTDIKSVIKVANADPIAPIFR